MFCVTLFGTPNIWFIGEILFKSVTVVGAPRIYGVENVK